jgi:hypothetical protein
MANFLSWPFLNEKSHQIKLTIREQVASWHAALFGGLTMANQWYYGRDGHKHGPVSADQLKSLAAKGHIERSDTIWREGVQEGFPAATVKHLFPVTADAPLEASLRQTSSISSEEQSSAGPVDSGAAQSAAPEPNTVLEPKTFGAGPLPAREAPSEAVQQANARRFQPRKARANAVTGAIILRVEDTSVVYRKKCNVCGYEDASQSRIPVRNGVTRLSFFCPKCRKPRPVQIQGIA